MLGKGGAIKENRRAQEESLHGGVLYSVFIFFPVLVQFYLEFMVGDIKLTTIGQVRIQLTHIVYILCT